jgi:PhnB protein
MASKPVPEGYHAVAPYLLMGGVPDLIGFLGRAFEAREISRLGRSDGSVPNRWEC